MSRNNKKIYVIAKSYVLKSNALQKDSSLKFTDQEKGDKLGAKLIRHFYIFLIRIELYYRMLT